jgi:hypothetical protein
MAIRLTDLDQNDETPIEMMRDPVGVLLIGDNGWSAVSIKAGVSETGMGSPSGLPGAMSWITNKPFDHLQGLRMTIGQSDLRLRPTDWLKMDLDEMLEEWAADRLGELRKTEILAKSVDRVIRLSYEAIRIYADLSPTKEQALFSMIERSGSLATGFRTALSAEMERDLSSERKLSGATYSAMKFGAFVLEDSSLSEDEVMVRLRLPRFAYAESVLSRKVPANGKWQQAKLDNADMLTAEHIRDLQELARPVLVTARAQAIKGAEDPFLATWTIPGGQGIVRKTFTLEEVVEMSGSYRFYTPMVMVGPGWKPTAASSLLDAVASACGTRDLAHASWSAGVVSENVLCGAMRNGRVPRGKTDGVTSPESVWIGAYDRIAMRPLINALSGFGMTLMGGYAGGVRFKTSRDPEMLSGVINAAWEIGLHAQMGLVRQVREMGGEIIADKDLYGGNKEQVIAPLFTQAGRTGPLWKIEEIIDLSPEKRAHAFSQLIGET